ncbi:aspartate aminotransferase family protein [Sorangium sp. So ce1128]
MQCDILTDDRSHVFRSWSAQKGLSPLVVAGGSGSWFWDDRGRRYLDFCSQRVNLNLGHQHPRLVAAIREQAGSIATLSQIHATAPRSEAARLIAERTPGDLHKIFFTNSGTDAVEHAVRMARLHTGRHKVFTMHRSYHGSTGGSIVLTGDPRRWDSEPGMPGVVRFSGPYLYRTSFNATSDAEECERALAHLEELLMYECPSRVAAILLEPIVGSNGVLVPPGGYLEGVRKICDRHGIVMICDEVMSGFGRCGEWFAVNKWGVVPDLITFAKGVNSGYIPLGGIAISRQIAETFADRPFPGGGTYFGHPLACATAVASIKAFEEESILDGVRRLGSDIFGPGLQALAKNHPSIGEIRGTGCFWALELVKNRQTREMLVPFNASGSDATPMKELEKACRERGLWVLTVGNRLHVCPPLIISDEDAQLGLSILNEALGVTDRYVT